jgi:hypothetical protein
MKEKTSWADFSKPRTPAIHETAKVSMAKGREMMAQAAPSANDLASSKNRREARELAQRKSAGIIEKLLAGGGRGFNPLATKRA